MNTVNPRSRLVGVIAELDLFQQTPEANHWHNSIDSVMQTNFVCFKADTPPHLIGGFFRRSAYSRVVIVDEDQPVGTITHAMLLRWATGHFFFSARPAPCADPTSLAEQVDHLTSNILRELGELEKAALEAMDESGPAPICAATRLQEQRGSIGDRASRRGHRRQRFRPWSIAAFVICSRGTRRFHRPLA